MWPLGEQLLIQLYLLTALLFWAFPDISLGFARTSVLIKTKGCCISPWFIASKRSVGTESVNTPSLVQEGAVFGWNALKMQRLLVASAQPSHCLPRATILQQLGHLGWGNCCWREWGKKSCAWGKKGFWAELFNCSFGVGSGLRILFRNLWGFSSFQCVVEFPLFPCNSLHFGSLSIY